MPAFLLHARERVGEAARLPPAPHTGRPASAELGLPAIPGYEVLGLINAGGMGVVYRARQLRPDRLVALKTIRPGFADHPEIVRRFRREARIAVWLAHPNIVPVYDVGQFQGQPFFSMKLIEGG